jgi:hypothetical protein
MPSGSCFCGNIKIEYSAERTIAVSTQNTKHVHLHLLTFEQGLCHCLDCRKLSGSPYTFNFIAKRSEIEVTGTPKAIRKTADSENTVVNYFCSDCGEIGNESCMHSDTMLTQNTRYASIRRCFIRRWRNRLCCPQSGSVRRPKSSTSVRPCSRDLHVSEAEMGRSGGRLPAI